MWKTSMLIICSANTGEGYGVFSPCQRISFVHPPLSSVADSELAASWRKVHLTHMKTAATFTARIVRDGKWFIAFSPEFPEGNGQGLTEEEALESLRESILLLLEDRREDARASLGNGEKLIPLALS